MGQSGIEDGTVQGVRRGETVRVRSREEILATLDADGTIDGLPFTPEMLQFCGRELPVYARADKTCDAVGDARVSRRMTNTVHLTGARCDGSAHDGCQASCLLYWREEWLAGPGSQVDAQDGSAAARTGTATGADEQASAEDARVEALYRGTTVGGDATQTKYRCQATEVMRASSPLSPYELGQYVDDIRTRNVSTAVVARGLLIVAFNKYQRLSTRLPAWLQIKSGHEYPFYQGTGTGARTPVLDLQPGELVEVKSKDEIMATLSPTNRNRGMWFDGEMLPYVGKQFRVVGKVDRIIDEQTGRMLKLSDCVVLEGVVCKGIYHRFCQRATVIFWREAWLRRVP